MAKQAQGQNDEELAFEDTPRGWAARWKLELDAAHKRLRNWHDQGDKINKRYRDDRETGKFGETRLALFTSNVQTQEAMLYGQVPKATASRRFADAKDDDARVAAEILERLINMDLEADDDTAVLAFQQCIGDFLRPGFGAVWLRYEIGETEPGEETPAQLDDAGNELAPAVEPIEHRPNEKADVDYVHWRDVRWGYARVWHEVPWLGRRAEMSRKQLVKRFGEKIGNAVPLNAKKGRDRADRKESPWGRAEVWEIWHKETRQVFWYVDGYGQTLDIKDDPLGLAGFWPCPRPLFANLTTDELLPTPDYVLHQDLYDEINTVSTRITLLERAIRVAGVYDKTSVEIKRLLTNTGTNELIPVDKWALFGEKGGLKGVVDWFPLEQIVAALTSLRDYRSELIELLYQVTGMSDIMRGQATSAGATATEQRAKVQFGSVRMQRKQDEIARFVSDTLRLKAEIISLHFEPETILQRSNCQQTADAERAPAAVQLIKDKLWQFRIEVKPEAVSLTDFAALKRDRTEAIGAIAQFMTAAAPVVQQMPGSMPYLLEMLQWAFAGLRGAGQIEGVLDRAIASAEQQAQQAAANPQQPQQDPKVIAQQMKGQQDLAKTQAELDADITREQVRVQADAQREENQRIENTREAAAKAQIQAANRVLRQPPNGTGGPL